MARLARLQVESLPEGVYLATSDVVPGLVAQGRSINETIEIVRDVARRLIEAQRERGAGLELQAPGDSFDYPMLVAV